jgi:curved DNA-binding protein CbpA
MQILEAGRKARGNPMSQNRFIDYYEILQVSPHADPETIERVFRLLAKRYHPDNVRTGDPARFGMITEAFRTVSDPEKRAAYDATYDSGLKEQLNLYFSVPTGKEGSDQIIQTRLLAMLYMERRRNPSDPGIGIFELEKFLEIPEGQMEFHLWYLKEKNWIQRTEAGKYTITVEGVDAVAKKDWILRKNRLLTRGSQSPSQNASKSPK